MSVNTLMSRVFVDENVLRDLPDESDPLKRTAMALRHYVPVEVTSFYLMFHQAAAGQQDRDIKALAQFTLLPILGLLATLVVSAYKNKDEKSTETKWWKKVKWPGVVVSAVAFIGWVYVTGGQFFSWAISPFIAAIIFAFLGIVVPAAYGFFQKPTESK